MEPVITLVLAMTASATSAPAYELDFALDAPVLAIAGVASFAWVLRDELAPPFCGLDCDERDVFVLDRFAAGQFDPGWRTVSDVTILSTYGLVAATILFDGGLANGANDLVVIAESILVSNALGALTNLGARRPRPLAYGTRAPESERLRGNASLSFFSGHTAGSFAAAVSTFMTLRRLHPGSALPYVALGVGLGAASFIGVSRILAGDHFPTDVLAGALVGSAVGILIPSLHDSPVRVAGAPGGASIAVAF